MITYRDLAKLVEDNRNSFTADQSSDILKWSEGLGDNVIYHTTRHRFDDLRPANQDEDSDQAPLQDEHLSHFSESPIFGADFIGPDGGYIHAYRIPEKKFFHLSEDLGTWSTLDLLYHIAHKGYGFSREVKEELMRIKNTIRDQNLAYEDRSSLSDEQFDLSEKIQEYVEGLFISSGYQGFSYTNTYEGGASGADSLLSYAVFNRFLHRLDHVSVMKIEGGSTHQPNEA